jgi:hypothetical protein
VDHFAALRQFFEAHMQKEKELWEFRLKEKEAYYESRLSELRADIVALIKQNANRGHGHAAGNYESRAANTSNERAEGHYAFRRQGYFPPPDPLQESVDTPNVNAYIRRTAELDEAKANNTTLAVEGAKVAFVEHNGTNILAAQQKIIVHAVGGDLWCSKGAARDITQEFGKPKAARGGCKVGDIIRQDVGNECVILHLVTKKNSPDKLHKTPEPFLRDVKIAFEKLAEVVREEKLEEIAMTYLCSGLDRLHRLWVMDLLYKELKDVPVTVHFYNKYESQRWNNIGQLFAPRVNPTIVDGDRQAGVAIVSSAVAKEAGEEIQVVDVVGGQAGSQLARLPRVCGPPNKLNP